MSLDLRGIQPTHSLVVRSSAAATLPTPATSSDGVSLSAWKVRSSIVGYTQAVVCVSADAASSITSPKLYGYGAYGPAGAEQWFLVGDLNNGDALSLTATVGFAQIMQFPGVFSRLAVGGTPSAGNITYTATPIVELGNA